MLYQYLQLVIPSINQLGGNLYETEVKFDTTQLRECERFGFCQLAIDY